MLGSILCARRARPLKTQLDCLGLNPSRCSAVALLYPAPTFLLLCSYPALALLAFGPTPPLLCFYTAHTLPLPRSALAHALQAC